MRKTRSARILLLCLCLLACLGGCTQRQTTQIDHGDWRLLLVSRAHPLPDDFTVSLTTLGSGFQVDARIRDDLQRMMDACRAEGLSPLICSAYRSIDTQSALFDNKQERLRAAGVAEADVYEQAASEVAIPGTSEHHTGLALDIVDESYQLLDAAQEQTPVQQWLLNHAWEYGFILRYPNGTSEITGIIYEPWHYRYVGADAAREIHENGLTLEAYLGQA